jgi:hypothetical protein
MQDKERILIRMQYMDEKDILPNTDYEKYIAWLEDKILNYRNAFYQAVTQIPKHSEVKCPIPLKDWPDWAEWAAMDSDGKWFAYSTKPEINTIDFVWHIKNTVGRAKEIGSQPKCDFNWYETLTHRSEL